MSRDLQRFVDRTGKIPLAWAGSTTQMNYLNLGDALSPVMVALLSGRDIVRIPTVSRTPRLAAVGTIGHGFKGGEVTFWGSGCSKFTNPSAKSEDRITFEPPPDTVFNICATRGPVSEMLLSGGKGGSGVYGDPVWLLPRFYRPALRKRWKLGVILHLSELVDRDYETHFNPQYRRYEIPASQSSSIRLINTVTPIGITAAKDRLDEILSCERIVSTSLHGMVFAESYGIPCLYFGVDRASPGLTTVGTSPESKIDLRTIDMYGGLGLSEFNVYNQDRMAPTNWNDVIKAIDDSWYAKSLDEQRLINAFPFELMPIVESPTDSLFDLPLLRHLQLQHDVSAVRAEDAKRKTWFQA